MIVDFMPVSMVDFPEKIATTVFVSGCNFRCPYCHNSSILSTKKTEPIQDQLFTYLDKRRHLIDGVCISGGEPTMWQGLRPFIEDVRQRGFSVKLDTNGSRPEVLKELIETGMVDYVAMDIKGPLSKYGMFTQDINVLDRINESVKILMQGSVPYEFRTTVHEKLLDVEDFNGIAKWLKGARRYVLQGYRYSEGVLDSDFCGQKSCNIDFLHRVRDLVSESFGEVLVRA